MKRRFGVIGNVSTDVWFESGFTVSEFSVRFDGSTPPAVFETVESIFPGGKLCLRKPLDLAGLPFPGVKAGPGGGGLGTTFSLAEWLAPAGVIYLDVSLADPSLKDYFLARGVHACFCGLRPPPVNLVLGYRKNKIGLKSPLSPVSLTPELTGKLKDLLAGCDCIVLNSVKEEELVRLAVDAARARSSCRLAAVVTRSLKPEFIREVLLPHVDVLVASFDEMDWLLGGKSYGASAARELLQRLLPLVPRRASAFVTMGGDGVMCGSRDGFFHVRLKNEAARAVAETVTRRPAALTGAGDWFAGGVIASHYTSRWPQVSPFPEIVRSGVSGCISALHHLGANARAEDFAVREDVLSEINHYSSPTRPSRHRPQPAYAG